MHEVLKQSIAMRSTWEAMERDRNIGQDLLFGQTDFNKAYDRVDWAFIMDMI